MTTTEGLKPTTRDRAQIARKLHLGPHPHLSALVRLGGRSRTAAISDGVLPGAQGDACRGRPPSASGESLVRRSRPARLPGLPVPGADAEPGHARQHRPGPPRAGAAGARRLPAGHRLVHARAAADPGRDDAGVARRDARPRALPVRHRGELPDAAARARRGRRTAAGVRLDLQRHPVADLHHARRCRRRVSDRDAFRWFGSGGQPRQLLPGSALAAGAGGPRGPLQGPFHGLRRLTEHLCGDLQRRASERLVHRAVAPLRLRSRTPARRRQHSFLRGREPHRHRA